MSDPQAWPLARAYRQTSHWFAAGELQQGGAGISCFALKYKSTLLSERLAGLYEDGSRWWPRWARVPGTLAAWVGVEAHAPIAALASRDPAGDTLAVCGHDDGSVSIWRLDNRSSSSSTAPGRNGPRLLARRRPVPGRTDCRRGLGEKVCAGIPGR